MASIFYIWSTYIRTISFSTIPDLVSVSKYATSSSLHHPPSIQSCTPFPLLQASLFSHCPPAQVPCVNESSHGSPACHYPEFKRNATQRAPRKTSHVMLPSVQLLSLALARTANARFGPPLPSYSSLRGKCRQSDCNIQSIFCSDAVDTYH